MTPEIRKSLLSIATEDAEGLYSEFGADGLWVEKYQLPSEASEFEEREYEEVLGPERLEEINSGHPPTEAELLALREARLEKLLSGDRDSDSTMAYSLAEVVDDEGNKGIALILCTGHSFSGLRLWVTDVFDTEEDALAHMNEKGWTS